MRQLDQSHIYSVSIVGSFGYTVQTVELVHAIKNVMLSWAPHIPLMSMHALPTMNCGLTCLVGLTTFKGYGLRSQWGMGHAERQSPPKILQFPFGSCGWCCESTIKTQCLTSQLWTGNGGNIICSLLSCSCDVRESESNCEWWNCSLNVPFYLEGVNPNYG